MDRFVSAGWFDYMIPDTNFAFRNFLHNIPRGSMSIQDSQRSSYLDSSSQSTIIIEEEDVEIKAELLTPKNAWAFLIT